MCFKKIEDEKNNEMSTYSCKLHLKKLKTRQEKELRKIKTDFNYRSAIGWSNGGLLFAFINRKFRTASIFIATFSFATGSIEKMPTRNQKSRWTQSLTNAQ